MLKICSKCKKSIEENEINKYTSYCPPCRKEYARQYRKQYYQKNKDIIKKQVSEYDKKNLEKSRYRKNKYHKKRTKLDTLFKLSGNLRCRLYQAFKAKKWLKKNKLKQYIGCTLQQLKFHLEKQFKDGMTWENQGKWHIDHIIPLSSAKTEEELYKLCHFSNLQPLWAVDNIKKSNKI